MQVKLIISGVFYLLCFTSSNLIAQTTKESNSKNNLVIEGTVYDQSTRKPLEYASVALANNQIGTITNVQGKFRLLVPEKYKESFIKISFIGYKTVNYKITNQKSFWLPEDPRMLAEVTFQGLKTATILKKALKKIPDNYYQKPYTTEGFYRATSRKNNKDYISIGEGAFRVYQTQPARKNQVLLKKLRSTNHELYEGFTPLLATTTLLNLDVVNRSKRVRILDKKGLKNHVFQVKKVVPYEDTEVYVITFNQKDSFKGVGYKGEFWIDKHTFAFVYLDFAFSPKGIGYYKEKLEKYERYMLDELGITTKLLKYRRQHYYKKMGGRYYLHRASIIQTKQIDRLGMYNIKDDYRVDYLVTAYYPEQTKPFPKDEVIKSKKWQRNPYSFYESAKPGFWNAYNILLPEVSYADVAKRLKAANEALKQKEKETKQGKEK
ncbi:hypothetical protein BKI52_31295 [marine bacterium AO1-C]|nr:hypothetical protein BKI52_31295 [marine bacterium AO1-C]